MQHADLFLESMSDDHVAVKIDFSNAFNCIRRDSVLAAVADAVPEIYSFCHFAYNHSSIHLYGNKTIESQEGVQQGDPLGSLFSLVVHSLLNSLCSNLAIGYIDDFTLVVRSKLWRPMLPTSGVKRQL